ncbi:hypothetical protein KM043_011515 [Ampulex compressa]|nr:hypothetical protein KM043_011515 [Ampulex compressa]
MERMKARAGSNQRGRRVLPGKERNERRVGTRHIPPYFPSSHGRRPVMDVENSITLDLWLPALGIFIIGLHPTTTASVRAVSYPLTCPPEAAGRLSGIKN